MNATDVRVRVFYPADPMGIVPAGVDSFLRGLLKWAPEELDFSLVGMTTDPAARPLGRWTRCSVGHREFDFFPVVVNARAGKRGPVPLSLRFNLATWRRQKALRGGFDVFDFHRIETSLLFAADSRPRNAYFHNDPQTLQLSASDNLWKYAPATYRRLERRAVAGLTSAWCVRDSGVQVLRQRYPARAERIRFIPTWVDPEVFHRVDDAARGRLRADRAREHGLDPSLPWLVTVGRLDTQKDPELMLQALARLHREGRKLHWLVIGDGVLRAALERKAAQQGLGGRACFVGLQSQAQIADWLRAADVFALSSAYEGMPMALLEALGSGLPAAVTDVGEVRRVVQPGVNGAIAAARDAAAFAQALADVLDGAARLGGDAALAAVAPYHPRQVLAPAYANYLELGHRLRALRLGVDAALTLRAPSEPPRQAAMGIPIDTLDRDRVSAQLLSWAGRQESRYVCFVNVHSSVHAAADERHRLALLGADLAMPDGAPLAWTLGVKQRSRQQRIDGPGVMWRLCHEAAAAGIKVGLYGATIQTLQAIERKLRTAAPDLKLAYLHAPPFRDLTAAEDVAVCADIERSGIGLLFVGLGCPRQEYWMAEHRGRIRAVMLGVGAAFNFHAGLEQRAPLWMRESGLEWLHRMIRQPRRLGLRYLYTNTVFLAKTAQEISNALACGGWRGGGQAARQRPDGAVPAVSVADGVDTVTAFAPPRHLHDPRPFEMLVNRVDACLSPDRPRLIGFISSGAGEGTSTLARAYVAAATRLPRRVLLLETQAQGWGCGVMQELAARRSLRLQALPDGGLVAALGGDDTLGAVAELAARRELWDDLCRHFDDIVLDLPAAHASATGIALAAFCDGVVVVLEAEKTRAPVARSLLTELQAVRANVLGAVLNKRRYHVPERIYRWL